MKSRLPRLRCTNNHLAQGSALHFVQQEPVRSTPLFAHRRPLRSHHGRSLLWSRPPLETAPDRVSAGTSGTADSRSRDGHGRFGIPRLGARRLGRRPRHHVADAGAGSGQENRGSTELRQGRYDGAAVCERYLRRCNDRVWDSQRAGPRPRARRDCTGRRAGGPLPISRLRSADESSRPGFLSRLPDGGRLITRVAAPWRPRHVSLHSCIAAAIPRQPSSRSDAARTRIRTHGGHTRAGGASRHSPCV